MADAAGGFAAHPSATGVACTGAGRGAAAATGAVTAEGSGAGVPCSMTVTDAVAVSRADLPRKSSPLVPIMTRKRAAIAVCGLMAQRPAMDTARPKPLRIGTTLFTAIAAARTRSSRSGGGSTSGTEATRRVARNPPMSAAHRAHPVTCRLAAALVSWSSSP